MSTAQQGAQLVLRSSATLAKALISSGGWAIKAPIAAAAHHAKNQIDTGKMSEKRLQKVTGADLHEIKLDPKSIKEVDRSLAKAGVSYAVEQSGDSYFLHFQGKDTDHVEHAVSRAFESIGLTFDPQQTRDTEPTGKRGYKPDPAEKEARGRAAQLLPEDSRTVSPDTQLVFNTVEWDPQGEIITNNLEKLNIPYSQSEGPGSMQQTFTFPQDYAPAVTGFIDAYSDSTMPGFDRSRVANYTELSTIAEKKTGERGQEAPVKTQKEPGRSQPVRKNKKEFMTRLTQKTAEKLGANRAADQITKTKGKTR
jgi:hypothetical protein